VFGEPDYERSISSSFLTDRQLDKARDLAQKKGDRISPSDLKIARDKVLQCVPSRKPHQSCVLNPVSAAEAKAGLESKSGLLSKFLQARKYRKSAKEALRFVKVTLAYHIAQEITFLMTS
jgi:hypothetical protein